jgi:CubicO group peptidase (beta-lactamase class C family)
MKRLFALCACALIPVVTPAQVPVSNYAATSAALQAIVANPLKPLASLSAVVIRTGRVVYEGHFGYRTIAMDPAAKNIAVDHDTLYRIASVSKMVTTMGVMQLVDAGTLDLDADISKYLGFKVRNPHFADVPITTRMLLSHTSSLRDEAGYFFPLATSLQSVLDPKGTHYGKGEAWAAPVSESDRAPGRYFEYVNLNFGVVGTIIEAITKQRFDLYMQAQILKPLGIAGGYTPETLSPADFQNLAVLYRKGTEAQWNTAGPWVPQVDDYRGQVPPPRAGLSTYVPGTNATGFGPQGGLRVSAAGLAKVMQMLMNGGALGIVRILRPESVQAMTQLQWQNHPGQNNGDTLNGIFHSWGLGMQRFEDVSGPSTGDRFLAKGGVTGVGHLGEAYGLNSGFIYDPASRNGVIYAIGGIGTNPEHDKGQYSSFQSWEESVLNVLFSAALQLPPPGAN